jgi:flagellar biosynthesis/type III secretory pathway protein FliH
VTTLGRARIIPASPASRESSSADLPVVTPERQRRIADEEIRAREAAREILARARSEAAAIVDEARRGAEAVAHEAAEEARQAEEAKLAAMYLHLVRTDEQRAERDLDRAITLAVVLSERLLGKALEQDPRTIVQLARQALAEARGARRATIEASPLDVEALERDLVEVGFASHAVDVRADPALGRGSLRISTNLGTLDAQLHPQLERLARALRDSLQPR